MQTEDFKGSGCLDPSDRYNRRTRSIYGGSQFSGPVMVKRARSLSMAILPTLGKPEIGQLNWRLHGSINAPLYLTTTSAGVTRGAPNNDQESYIRLCA